MSLSSAELDRIKDILNNYKIGNIFGYERLKEFFYNVIVNKTYNYKIILNENTQMLFTLFVNIFESFPSEIPGNEYKVNGVIGNKELLDNIDVNNSNIMLIDSVIDKYNINDLKEVVNQLKDKVDYLKIWTNCIDNSVNVDSIYNYLGQCIFLPKESRFKINEGLQKLLTKTFLNIKSKNDTYQTNLSIGKIKNIFNKNQFIDNKNTSFYNGNIKSTILFLDLENDLNTKYNIKTCIRIYERDELVLLTPFVLLSNLETQDNIKTYAQNILNDLNIEYNFNNMNDSQILNYTKRKISDYLMNIISNNIEIEKYDNYWKDGIYTKVDTDNSLRNKKETYNGMVSNESYNNEIEKYIYLNLYNGEYHKLNDLIDSCRLNLYLNKNIEVTENEIIAVIINMLDSKKIQLKDIKIGDYAVETCIKSDSLIYKVLLDIFKREFIHFYKFTGMTFETRYGKLFEFAEEMDKEKHTKDFSEFLKIFISAQYETYKDVVMNIPLTDILYENEKTHEEQEKVNDYVKRLYHADNKF